MTLSLLNTLWFPLFIAVAGGEEGPLFPIRAKFKSEMGFTYKQGYMDRTGKVKIEPRFSQAKPFREGMALVAVEGDWGFIDGTGKLVVPTEYRWADDFSGGLAQVLVVQEDGEEVSLKCGYLDKTGKMAVEARFDFDPRNESPFQDGRACVRMDGKWGLIDKEGKFLIEPLSDTPFVLSEDLACVSEARRYGFIDSEGKTVIKPRFEMARSFSMGRARVMRGGRWGFIDRSGKEVIEAAYDGASDFFEGLACVTRGGKAGFIDLMGNPAVPFDFDKAGDFSEGVAWVCREGKWGLIDRKGEFVFEPALDSHLTPSFCEGLARIDFGGGKWGFVDRKGSTAIEPRFDSASDFNNGLSFVTMGSFPTTYAYIDKQGDFIWKLED